MVIRKYDVKLTGDNGSDVQIWVNQNADIPSQDVTITYKEILSPNRDSHGRSRCVAYDMKFEWSYMSNSNVDIKAIHAVIEAFTPEAQLLFVDVEGEAGTITIGTLTGTIASGGVIPIMVPKIDGNGKYESLKIWCDKIMSKEKAMAILGNEP